MTFTGEGIQFYQLVSLRMALRIQAMGLRRPGPSPLQAAKRLGFKANTAAEAIPLVTAAIEKFHADHPNGLPA